MKVKRNRFDIVVDILCLILLIGVSVYLILQWNDLPDKVPGHYNIKGEVDRWGSKSELFILPITGWVLYIGITALEAFPKIWNTGVTITKENKERVYRLLKTMIGVTKLLMVFIFTLLEISGMKGESLPWYFTVLYLGGFFGELIFFIVRLVKIK